MSAVALPRLLVVGGPHSGKTTYRAQFLVRLEHKPGELKLIKSVGDRTAIDSEISRVMQGLQVMHTNADTFHSTSFEVGDSAGRTFVLDFADYGGEQVRRLASSNDVSNQWVDLVRNADAWLLFLRIDKIRTTKSFMSDPVESAAQSAPLNPVPRHDSSTEIGTIEILQRLLFVRGASLQYPLVTPRLAVALSCSDELPPTERELLPSDLLQRKAPLLAHFLKANWQTDRLELFSLSSTEEPLLESVPNQAFIDKGAENVGYVQRTDGSRVNDLTVPIAWLMQSS